MRYRHWPRWIVILLAAALLASCAWASQPGGDGADPEPGGDQGSADGEGAIDWEIPAMDELPGEVAAWIEEQQTQIGISQMVADGRTYILVAWGEKPTGGYEVTVEDVAAAGEEALRLDIKLTAPEDEAAVTQAITYPFALIAVEPGSYYRLEPHFDGGRFLENRSFRIEEPALFSEVTDHVRVAGEARVFEGVFQITVEDGHNVLADEVMQVAGAPAWAPFDVTLELTEQPTSPNGVVFIYTHSAQDGSIVDAIAIPISFADWN